MTVPSTSRRAGPFTGTGALVSYPFTFKVTDATELRVVVADTSDVESTLVLNSSFLVTLNGDQETSPGGSVQYAVGGVATALPSGYALVVTGENVAYGQASDLPTGGAFSPTVYENALDQLAKQIMTLRDQLGRAVMLADTTAGVDPSLPVPAASELLGWSVDGASLVNYAPTAGAGVALADLASTAIGKGASLVGYSGAVNYVAGTFGGHSIGTVCPHDFPWLADRSGAAETLAGGTGLAACIAFAKANNYGIEFAPGTYKHSAPMTIDWDHARVTFRGRVTLRYTGGATAAAWIIDGGVAPGLRWDVEFGRGNKPIIEAPLATAALWSRSMHHGYVGFTCTAAATTALQVNFAVATRFSVTTSVNEAPWVTRPVNAMKLDARNVSPSVEGVADCIFDNCIIEGVSGDGVVSTFGQNCLFLGGTSEANGGRGYYESGGGNLRNTYLATFCEHNTGADYELGGSGTLVLAPNAGSSGAACVVSGNRNVLQGGFWQKLSISGYANILRDLTYMDVANGGSFSDTGVGTVYDNVSVTTANGQSSVANRSRKPRLKAIGSMTVTAATKATKCLVTIPSNGLDYGESVTFTVGAGMTQLNGNTYQVEPVADTDNFYILSGGAYVDSSAFGVFTAGTAANIALAGTWVPMAGGFRDPVFAKDADGFVHLTGSIKNGTSNTTAFTLPSGYRPAGQMVFITSNFAVPNTNSVSISPAGVVAPVNATNTSHVGLDGIVFRAEQ